MKALEIYNRLMALENLPAFFTPAGADESFAIAEIEDGEDGVLLHTDTSLEGMMSHAITWHIADYGPEAEVVVRHPYSSSPSEIFKVEVEEGGWINLLE